MTGLLTANVVQRRHAIGRAVVSDVALYVHVIVVASGDSLPQFEGEVDGKSTCATAALNSLISLGMEKKNIP